MGHFMLYAEANFSCIIYEYLHVHVLRLLFIILELIDFIIKFFDTFEIAEIDRCNSNRPTNSNPESP